MSDRLLRIINELTSYYFREKILPTFREMKDLFGVKGTRSVSLIVDKLIDHGYLLRNEKWLTPWPRLLTIPVFESVSAWFFAPATEERYEINLEHYLIDKPENTYIVKVVWDSMKNVWLLPGDFVIVDQSKKQPHDGEIVIAQTDDGWVTVKTYRKQGEKVRLQPENENYPSIIPVYDTNIVWLVISSFRRF